jgi:hypothetical protein
MGQRGQEWCSSGGSCYVMQWFGTPCATPLACGVMTSVLPVQMHLMCGPQVLSPYRVCHPKPNTCLHHALVCYWSIACRVYVELLGPQDLSVIASTLHPRLLDRMVALLGQLDAAANGTTNSTTPSLQHGGPETSHQHAAGAAKAGAGTGGGARFAAQGGPWEFNLRDLLRWANLVEGGVAPPPLATALGPIQNGGSKAEALQAAEHAALDEAAEHYARMLFAHRLRTAADRERFAQVGG